MKIFDNLLIKMKNKYFWLSLVSLIIILLDDLGINLNFDLEGISNTILSIMVLLGIINDNGIDKNQNGIDDRLE